ncbi:helix-turn-helix transcriptional regulator [Thiomicrorhabdus sp. Milos-T2]|uniref:helix-turn-helix transcriptional regulator n=1 Tax=Thiomicrorhabdus sp. Milos-T2 TaxID=90814 RepID=UPI0004949CB5|nr:helix-turn-helix transcriptional regulator [Thiomicrorhabdus sp. Milos-T2]
MIKNTNQLVQELYRKAYSKPINEFKQCCFDLISEHFKIDSGTWITRCEIDSKFYNNDSFTYKLPENFIEHCHHIPTVSRQIEQVFGVVLGNQGKTFDILDIVPEEEWYESDMYKMYCEEFSLYHSVMTVSVNPLSQTMNLITLARHDPEHKFSEAEKKSFDFLYPNLIEALRVNILNSFQQKSDTPFAFRAVADFYGNIIEAEEGFLNLLHSKSLIKDNKVLFKISTENNNLQVDNLIFKTQNHKGIVYIEAIAPPVIKTLGKRKIEVCKELIIGKSNKEIAKTLNLSPNTVNNHLKEIFKALNINSRHQAIAYLTRQNF